MSNKNNENDENKKIEIEEVEDFVEIDDEIDKNIHKDIPYVPYRDEKNSFLEKETSEPEEKEATEQFIFDGVSFDKEEGALPEIRGDERSIGQKEEVEVIQFAEETDSVENNKGLSINKIEEPESEVEPEVESEVEPEIPEETPVVPKKRSFLASMFSKRKKEKNEASETEEKDSESADLSDIDADLSEDESISLPADKPKDPKKKLFFILAGFIIILILGLLVLSFVKDTEGNTYIDKLFGIESEQSEPTIPIDSNIENNYGEPSENPVFEEPIVEENTEPEGIVDEHTIAIQEALKQYYEPLKGEVLTVEKFNGVIRVDATIKKGNLLDINRLVRITQIESYPYLINELQATQVSITFGKHFYSFETGKPIIEFIAKLNYEDRHSAQMWWDKTKAYKNGTNLKASLIKDRLYVETLHPIYPEIEQEKEEDEASVEEGAKGSETSKDGTNTGSDSGSSKDPGTGTSDKNPMTQLHSNEKEGFGFKYPADSDIKDKTLTEDEIVTTIAETTKLLPVGVKFTATKNTIEGKDGEVLSKAFAIETSALEDSNTAYKQTKQKQEGTTFEGLKYLTRQYEFKDDVQNYYIDFTVYVAYGKTYTFSVTYANPNDSLPEYLTKSVVLKEVLEEVKPPVVPTTPPTTTVPNVDKEESKPTTPVVNGKIRGDKTTKLFYLPTSTKYESVSVDNMVVFISENEATKAGFKKGD